MIMVFTLYDERAIRKDSVDLACAYLSSFLRSFGVRQIGVYNTLARITDHSYVNALAEKRIGEDPMKVESLGK